MMDNTYKRSRATRYSWLGIAMFFIIFCSCPVKRFFKLQLYKHADPIEASSNNIAFSKELKDCNLIDKNRLVQVAVFHDITKPKPHAGDAVQIAFNFPSIFTYDLFQVYEEEKRPFLLPPRSHLTAASLPLYLRCHRLQV